MQASALELGAQVLPDGDRLHLQHGPIDLILWANAAARVEALGLAQARFATVLEEVVEELPLLRTPVAAGSAQRAEMSEVPVVGLVPRRMLTAVQPYATDFVTPMAAVAGAVADEICAAMAEASGLTKAYVNNGGDIAVFLAGAARFEAAMPCGRLALASGDVWRGIATSGWRGRSQSLGIADAVTVVARLAAEADTAATMIANAVDLPGHPLVERRAACEVAHDSDLGERPVTVAVGALTEDEIDLALARGVAVAERLVAQGRIGAAALSLGQARRLVGQDVVTIGQQP